LGFLPAFPGIAVPLDRRARTAPARAFAATLIAAIVSIATRRAGRRNRTFASGISALPLGTFASAANTSTCDQRRRRLRDCGDQSRRCAMLRRIPDSTPTHECRPTATVLLLLRSFYQGGGWFTSKNPDGLEWSVARSIKPRRSESGSAPIEATPGTVQRARIAAE
jgi:hypothetical protein